MAPMASVLLRPGVEIEATPALNEAGISQSQLIRTKNGLTQTIGGWSSFGTATIPSTIRSLHAWQDLRTTDYLGAAATSNLVALTATSYKDITPQTRDSHVTPNVSISSGSNLVTIVASDSGLSIADSVWFHTPISIGNLLLMGAYPVYSIISTGAFTIISSVVASTTIASSGILPIFTTTANSALVTVTQPNNTAAAIQGVQPSFPHASSVGNITIQGPYNVEAVLDSTDYIIVSPTAATSANSVSMNNGIAHYHYYITNAQIIPAAGGYGDGAYGAGGYGTGLITSGESGTPITSSDWTQENWGEVLLSIQADGPVYAWSPNLGYGNASLVPEAPLNNGGGFISMPQQILVLWKSVQSQGNGGFNSGGTQDNLIVRWCDAQDYTNWDPSDQTVAGSFHIPTGSVLRGGLQAPNYGVIWTDIDVWIMQFLGNDPVSAFNFTRAGSGCGLIGKHAAGVLAGDVYWCAEQNIFILSGGGVQVLPCTVWDYIFQGMNEAPEAKSKVVCAVNSLFNEVAFHFPFGTATENTNFVKYNTVDKTWDYGLLARTAWTDQSVVGHPIGADNFGALYQHEIGNHINGAGLSFFRTGWWTIMDGQELAFVDWIMPDFQWGTYGNTDAAINLTFFSVDYPGDTPRSYGPYTITQATEFLTPRIRGRLLAMEAKSANNNVFWRIGRIRYRAAPSGRR